MRRRHGRWTAVLCATRGVRRSMNAMKRSADFYVRGEYEVIGSCPLLFRATPKESENHGS